MKFSLAIAATALAATMALGSGPALAKAHDQGVADGVISFPDGTGAAVGSQGGVSGGQNMGTRGGIASGNGGDNRVVPVVGANEPD